MRIIRSSRPPPPPLMLLAESASVPPPPPPLVTTGQSNLVNISRPPPLLLLIGTICHSVVSHCTSHFTMMSTTQPQIEREREMICRSGVVYLCLVCSVQYAVCSGVFCLMSQLLLSIWAACTACTVTEQSLYTTGQGLGQTQTPLLLLLLYTFWSSVSQD